MGVLAKGVTDPQERQRIEHDFRTAHPVPNATLSDVADHIDHIRQVAGVDHVGLGSDFDGIDYGPIGLEDVSKFPALFSELIRRGWTDVDLKKLAGENLLRAFRQAEVNSRNIQATRAASTATIQQLDGGNSP
jgi:membrane dipeptidase